MTFTKRLRRGEITCTVRFWVHPRVTVGARYRMEDGHIQVDSIQPIGLPDITPELARGLDPSAFWTCSRSPNMVAARISI